MNAQRITFETRIAQCRDDPTQLSDYKHRNVGEGTVTQGGVLAFTPESHEMRRLFVAGNLPWTVRASRWSNGSVVGWRGDAWRESFKVIMGEPQLTFHCFFCGKQFEKYEPLYSGEYSGYRGMYIGKYMIEACDVCYASNSDVWERRHEGRLVAHLTDNGLPIPTRNAEGLLPRD
jgi:hypothetical protein